jgi:mercuric ion binding protein
MILRISISILLLIFIGIGKIHAQTKTVEIKTKIYCSHCTQCETCGQRFDNELYKLKGLKSFTISGNVIKVSYNPKKINIDQIRQCIANCGYDADEVKATEAGLATLDGCCRQEK